MEFVSPSMEQIQLLCLSFPAGGADLKATGEELQSGIEFSVVIEALQCCKTL